MSSQWWESAAAAEASTAPGAYNPVADEPTPDELYPLATHECPDPATCWVCVAVRAAVDEAARVRGAACECPPCPGRGNDGHRMTHCAECCFGTGVEADPACPTHGYMGGAA